jgi:hypothetical protein
MRSPKNHAERSEREREDRVEREARADREQKPIETPETTAVFTVHEPGPASCAAARSFVARHDRRCASLVVLERKA